MLVSLSISFTNWSCSSSGIVPYTTSAAASGSRKPPSPVGQLTSGSFPDYKGKPLININSDYLIIFDSKIHIQVIHYNPNAIITLFQNPSICRVFSCHIFIYNLIIHFTLQNNIVIMLNDIQIMY